MKNRTWEYLKSLESEKIWKMQRTYEVKEAVCRYKRKSPEVSAVALLRGFMEEFFPCIPVPLSGGRVCSSCPSSSFNGVGCKACGEWTCSFCSRLYDDVPLCMPCFVLVSPDTRFPCDISELRKTYALLKKCLKKMSADLFLELKKEIGRYEDSTTPIRSIAQMEQNLNRKLKMAVYSWHLYVEKQERTDVLLEQISYLKEQAAEVEGEEKRLLEESAEELLRELALCEEGH
jgi:hypothetical protein